MACAVLASWNAAIGQPTDLDPKAPTIGALEARATEVESSDSLDESTRQAVAGVYRDAAQFLKRADESTVRAREFKRLADDAPRQLDLVEDELAKPVNPPAPEIPQDATLAQLEQELAQANANLTVARERAADVDKEIEDRQKRRDAIPNDIAQLRQRIETLDEQIDTLDATTDMGEADRANLAHLVAERMAAAAELDAVQAERDSYEARTDLVTLRRDRENRRVAEAEKLAAEWQQIVSDQRAADARVAARAAAKAKQDAVVQQYKALADYAGVNEALASKRTGRNGVAAHLAWAGEEHLSLESTNARLRKSFEDVRELVDRLGMSRPTAVFLRRELQNLPSEQELRATLSRSNSLLEATELERVISKQQQEEVADVDQALDDLMNAVPVQADAPNAAEVRSVARDLVAARRTLLDQYVADLVATSKELVELSAFLGDDGGLIEDVQRYRDYIEGQVFWMRSISTRHSITPDVNDAWEAMLWLVNPTEWSTGAERSLRALLGSPAALAFGILSVCALAFAQWSAKKELLRRAELVSRYRTDSFIHTVVALLLTIPLAALWPWVLWVISRALLLPGDQRPVVASVGGGLMAGVTVLALLESIREVVRPHGLADAHFQWPSTALRPVRRAITVVETPLVMLLTISLALDTHAGEAYTESLGRVTFILGAMIVAAFLARVLAPDGPVLRVYLERNQSGMLCRFRYPLYAAIIAIPLLLGLMSLLGYHRAASQLDARMRDTFILIIVLGVANGMLLRWLFIAHRKLAIGEAKRKLAQSREESKDESKEGVTVNEDEIDVPRISAKTKLLFRNLVVISLLIGLGTIWIKALPGLRALDRVQLFPAMTIVGVSTDDASLEGLFLSRLASQDSSQTPESTAETAPFTLTVADVGYAAIIILITALVFRHLPALFEIMLLQHLPLDSGSRYAISTIMRYIIAIIGVMLAFGAIGIGWSKVQWLAAALTFGLAFGLQEIFANFISGIIMLVERPVRVGDTVTVEGVSGTVTRIRMRATTIMDWDRKELVIPNKTFITGQVINWSLSDTILRIIIPIGVSYDADVDLVRQTLLRIAAGQKRVLADPKPQALFRQFGDSTLNFELRAFVPSIDDLIPANDEICREIVKVFREKKIEIAYPQRDLRIRASDELSQLRDLVRPMNPAEVTFGASAQGE